MDWSDQQQTALAAVRDWLSTPEAPQVFKLFGYAGTGKTTLAKHLGDDVDGRVLYGAFTGKAALVLRQRGCQHAETIHQMIYRPKDKSAHRLKSLEEDLVKLRESLPPEEDRTNDQQRKVIDIVKKIEAEKKNLKRPSFNLNLASGVKGAALVVIDEVSMVDQQMATDLLGFEARTLVLGDQAQLPPVGGTGYFINGEPNIQLTEIHRQAEKSPIIKMATSIREGGTLSKGEFGEDCRVVPKGTLSVQELAAFDQVIVGRNRTRHIINRRIRREVLGFKSHLPVPGDRLVCLRNNHEDGLLNGGLWTVLDSQEINDDEIGLTIESEDTDAVVTTIAHRHHFEDRELPWYDRKKADEFTYGYALTCHKAQGSQFKSVAVVDEGACFRQDAAKWRYTAVTRAMQKLTVIQ